MSLLHLLASALHIAPCRRPFVLREMLRIRGMLIALFLTHAVLVRGSVLEFLEINIWSRDLQTFLDADSKIWTHFLSSQPGFIRKEVMTNPHDPAAGNCTVTVTILWESRELWKSVDPKQLADADALFVKEFGYEPIYTAKPNSDGYDVVAASDVRTPISNSEVHTELPSLARDSNASFRR